MVTERIGSTRGKHRRFVPKSHCTNEGKEEIAIPKMAGNYAPMEAAVQKVDWQIIRCPLGDGHRRLALGHTTPSTRAFILPMR